MATTDKNDATASKVTADRPEGGVANTSAADPQAPVDVADGSVAESRNASMRVSAGWPASKFVVEGIPEITREGTMLTKTQLKAAEEAAALSGVTLDVEEVK